MKRRPFPEREKKGVKISARDNRIETVLGEGKLSYIRRLEMAASQSSN